VFAAIPRRNHLLDAIAAYLVLAAELAQLIPANGTRAR
jgi:hypothetical protein